MVPISGYYLGASTSQTTLAGRPASISTSNLSAARGSPSSASASASAGLGGVPGSAGGGNGNGVGGGRNRQSMPPPARPSQSTTSTNSHSPPVASLPDVDEEEINSNSDEGEEQRRVKAERRTSGLPRGQMNKGFKFPLSASETPPVPGTGPSGSSMPGGSTSPPVIKIDSADVDDVPGAGGETTNQDRSPSESSPTPIEKDGIGMFCFVHANSLYLPSPSASISRAIYQRYPHFIPIYLQHCPPSASTHPPSILTPYLHFVLTPAYRN